MDLTSPKGMDLKNESGETRKNESAGLAREWKPGNGVGVRRGGEEKLSQSDITEAGWEQNDVFCLGD